MPYCSNCGSRHETGARFCSSCGRTLDTRYGNTGPGQLSKSESKPAKDKRCPYCNAIGNVAGPINGPAAIKCPVCRGRRYNLIPDDWLGCRGCGGTGIFAYGQGLGQVTKPCPDCRGTGWTPE